RIVTSWAGPYSGLILAGAGAIMVQALPNSSMAPILHRLSFLWILILLFNLIPLLELDGYFMLIDWLEMPMLRARAVAFFRRELMAAPAPARAAEGGGPAAGLVRRIVGDRVDRIHRTQRVFVAIPLQGANLGLVE